jgi:hypothetical protein
LKTYRRPDASEEAGRVWPGRIWKMAMACGLVFGLAVTIVATGAAYWAIKAHCTRKLADEILSTEKAMALNQRAPISFCPSGPLSHPMGEG